MTHEPPSRVLDRLHREIVQFRAQRLGELAVAREWISTRDLDLCLREQEERRGTGRRARLGELLREKGLLSPSQLETLLAEKDRRDSSHFAGAREEAVPYEVLEAQSDPERSFGKYTLVEEISRGGMGVIWKAWDGDLRRWVAIKVLKEEVTNERSRMRFLREAQMTAGLRHSHLVTVHDFGERGGRPYIVMELIRGETLDPRMPQRRFLEILLQTAQAVQAAHDKGLVHRDLKPANILVDDAGEPHIVDFGLVHILDPKKTLTHAGLLIGTPQYMAPEQIGGSPDQIGAWTDVHALGILLYESLAGAPPYYGDSVSKIMERILAEQPRTPPGPRDLAVVCMRAMEKDPAQRYASAGEFARDLRRFLDGEPVLARPPSLPYRIYRKLAKHRTLVATVLLTIVLLGGAAAIAGIGWLRGSRELRRQKEREDALLRARPFLDEGRDLLARLDMSLTGEDLDLEQVGELAEQCRAKFRAALREVPDLPEAIVGIGRSHRLEGNLRKAVDFFDRAVAAGEKTESARLERVLIRLEWYAVSRFRAGAPSGETEASAALLQVIMEDLDRLKSGSPGKQDLLLAEGILLFARGDYDKAAQALDRCAREMVSDHRPWYWSGMSWQLAGNHTADALEALNRALQFRPWEPVYRVQRGLIHFGLGDRRRALEDYEAAIRSNPRYGYAYNDRGVIRLEQGRRDLAEEDFRRAIELRPEYAMARVNLGRILQESDRVREAVEEYDRAIGIDGRIAMAFYNRGTAREMLEDWSGAEADYTKSIDLDPGYVKAYINRGVLRIRTGRPEEALEDFGEAIRLRSDDPLSYVNRAHLLKQFRRYAEAVQDYDRAIELDGGNASAFNGRGGAHLRLGEREKALADLNRAIELDPGMPGAYANRARLHALDGDREAAIADMEKALETAPQDWPHRAAAEEELRILRGERDPYRR